MRGIADFWRARGRSANWRSDQASVSEGIADEPAKDFSALAVDDSSAESNSGQFARLDGSPDEVKATQLVTSDAITESFSQSAAKTIAQQSTRPKIDKPARRLAPASRHTSGLLVAAAKAIAHIGSQALSGARHLIDRQLGIESLQDPAFHQFVLVIGAILFVSGEFFGGLAVLAYALVIRGFRLLGRPAPDESTGRAAHRSKRGRTRASET